MLRLYNFNELPAVEKQIAGISALNSRRHFARVVSEHGISFARGVRVEVEFDEEQYAGSGVYLFASILEYFLGLYTSLNSFSQLVVRTRQRKEILRNGVLGRVRKSCSETGCKTACSRNRTASSFFKRCGFFAVSTLIATTWAFSSPRV